MNKVKVSLYLDPNQLRLIEQIKRELKQKRSVILRDAVNCYISLCMRSRRNKRI